MANAKSCSLPWQARYLLLYLKTSYIQGWFAAVNLKGLRLLLHKSVHQLKSRVDTLRRTGLFLDPAHRTGPESRSSNALSHPSPSLKRLNFVRAYGTYYSTKIASIYGSSRKCLPVALRPGLQALEERISTAGSPLWWGLHLRSEQMLWALDSKVRCCALQGYLGQRLPAMALDVHPNLGC